jgi:uncharacterized protein YuzE
MKVTYDPVADAAYIYFNNLPVKKTVAVDADLNIDYNKNNIPVGLEILSVSKKMPAKNLKNINFELYSNKPQLLLHK